MSSLMLLNSSSGNSNAPMSVFDQKDSSKQPGPQMVNLHIFPITDHHRVLIFIYLFVFLLLE